VDHNSAGSWRQPEMVNRGGILGNAEPKSHQPRPPATPRLKWTGSPSSRLSDRADAQETRHTCATTGGDTQQAADVWPGLT
jgi:hypothetical protein